MISRSGRQATRGLPSPPRSARTDADTRAPRWSPEPGSRGSGASSWGAGPHLPVPLGCLSSLLMRPSRTQRTPAGSGDSSHFFFRKQPWSKRGHDPSQPGHLVKGRSHAVLVVRCHQREATEGPAALGQWQARRASHHVGEQGAPIPPSPCPHPACSGTRPGGTWEVPRALPGLLAPTAGTHGRVNPCLIPSEPRGPHSQDHQP